MNHASRLTKLLEMLENEPNDPFLLYGVALEYLNSNPSESETYFEKLLTNHPSYLPTYYQAGLFYFNIKNNPKKSIEILQDGIKLAASEQDNKALNELNELLDSIND